MLDLRHLRLLRAVAESGAMSRAAEQLSYTPSAVSQQVAALERQLGTALLVRHARGVRLTEVGRLLVERASALDDQLAELEAGARAMIDGRGGRLRLAAFSSASGRLIPAAIDRFRHDHPEVRMSLDIRDPQAAVAAVRHGEADVALIFDYPDGLQVGVEDLSVRRLLDDPMLVALPPDHPAGRRSSVRLGDLRTADWIQDCSPDPTCREELGRLCAAAGYRPQVSFESDDYLAVGRLVRAGVGVALVPGLAVEQMPAEVVLRPVDPAVFRRISVLRSDSAPPAADTMIDILDEVADQVAAPDPMRS